MPTYTSCLLVIFTFFYAHQAYAGGVTSLFKAQEYLHQNRPLRALKELEKAKRGCGSWGLYHLEMARALFLLNAPTSRLQPYIESALQKNKNNHRVHVIAGHFWRREKQTKRALHHYTIALQAYYPDAEACLAATDIWLQEGAGQKGLLCLNKLMYKQTLHPAIHARKALILTQQKQPTLAASLWKQAHPKLKDIKLLHKALSFYKTHPALAQTTTIADIQQRITSLQNAHKPTPPQLPPMANKTPSPATETPLTQQPHESPLQYTTLQWRGFLWLLENISLPAAWVHSATHTVEGLRALGQSDFDKAHTTLQKATTYTPTWGRIYLYIAQTIHLRGGETKVTHDALKKAHKWAPQAPEVHEFSGLVWEAMGAQKRALSHYTKALQHGKHRAARACMRVAVLVGPSKQSIRCLTALVNNGHNTPQSTLMLARLYSQQRQYLRAGFYWKRTLPHHTRSFRILKEALLFFANHIDKVSTKRRTWRQQLRNIRSLIRRLPSQKTRKLRMLLPSGRARRFKKRS